MLKSTDCAWASGAYIRRLILRPAFCLRFRYWDSEKDCLGCQWFWLQIREKNWLDKPEKFAHKARGPIAQVPLFDISWPMAYSSSGTPATMQWHFCLSLAATLVFAHRTGASVEVVTGRCQNCPSKLLVIWPIWAEISTATWRLSQSRSQVKIVQCKKVNLWSCSQPPVFPYAIRSSVFLIVDMTFHGQWHVPVRRRPSCSGSFARFWSHTGLANLTGASVEVV